MQDHNRQQPNTFMLSIIMPAYNEAATILEAIQAVIRIPYQKELIVVDDGSTDGTREILREIAYPDVRVVFQDSNAGKGYAISTGLKVASGDIVLIQDADLEYDPEEYPALLQPILAGKADVVYGSRFTGHGAHRVLYFWHYLGNCFLTFLSNMCTGLNLSDMEVCYKVFTRDALKGIEIREKRFGFEPEITARIAKKKLRIYEVPVSYHSRNYAEGKKIKWRDGIWASWCILRYNLLK